MRKIITTTFVTLDGVMQAPGGPTEDTSGGFAYGGWSANYWDDLMGEIMNGFMALPFELLLGKTTYDIFAAYWPTAKEDQIIAERFNGTKKWVVSDKVVKLSWHNSELIVGDVVDQIKQLKTKNNPDLWVHGSGNLIQTLLRNHLIDRMYIWTFPVTVGGNGKRLFSDGTLAQDFELIDSKASTTGVIIATYEPRGALKTGTL
ncbi:dihydrofolate reductase family protein [Dehalogenimonas etheniformans]|uniref:Dihydrofolate reductase n=1 Tax=Dehalogenimonas etheniformans TaxID=1536648 RepID=A0A2P5P620_9CHLR|nr:dihydrofolate reductase family protein [Dehalogenimonas etheniformans]PPD57744.1 dihydrofolate reductase [Dehalogenimonas etheniformans]QNT76086.1 dihydrofolate reductase [Dehalogenimonas etheniformans]